MKDAMLKEKYSPLLRQVGLKVTPERLAVLHVLDTSKKPLSVKGVKDKLKTQDIDQATIYRTIESLLKEHIVQPVNFQHDHNHYELVNQKHHHHVICQNCGKIADVSNCDTSNIEQQVRRMANFAEINTHALEFFGLCKSCAKKS
jgi:Fur family transcriptional regulator, ferric uptake regulator